jgi:hypothetical protein
LSTIEQMENLNRNLWFSQSTLIYRATHLSSKVKTSPLYDSKHGGITPNEKTTYRHAEHPSRILWKNFSIVIFAIQEMWPAVHGSQQAKAQWAGSKRWRWPVWTLSLSNIDMQCKDISCIGITFMGPGISLGILRHIWASLYLCYAGVSTSFQHCTDPNALNSWMSSGGISFHVHHLML